MRKLCLISFCAFIALMSACHDGHGIVAENIRNDIHIVGSSTIYPFSTKVAQEFSEITGQKIVVESTGSGGGHKLFCQSKTLNSPSITTSSRRQKKSEFDRCVANDIDDIIEIKIGFDGIVIANIKDAQPANIRIRDIYMALAKTIPTSDTNCTLRPNPHTTWQDINPDLPAHTIEAYGPPPTSGTRDAFVEIAMEGGARTIPCLASLQQNNPEAFIRIAHTLREDGKWIDGGENDNAVVQTLINTPTAIGVLGYSFLDQNMDKIKGLNVDGIVPSFETISTGSYPLSRSLYMYLKKDHIGKIEGLEAYAHEFISDQASGAEGYLKEIGLVPLPDTDRLQAQETVKTLTVYSQ